MKLARKRRVYLLAFIVSPLFAVGFVLARAFWPSSGAVQASANDDIRLN